MLKSDHPKTKGWLGWMLVSVELPVSSTVAVVTLRRWDKTGDLRPAWRTPGGHRRYSMDALNTMSGRSAPKRKTVGYARVSSHDQKDDLKRQADRLKGHAGTNDCAEPEIITDLGSGLNDKKRGLQRLLGMICRGEIDNVDVDPQRPAAAVWRRPDFRALHAARRPGGGSRKRPGYVRGSPHPGRHRPDDRFPSRTVWGQTLRTPVARRPENHTRLNETRTNVKSGA